MHATQVFWSHFFTGLQSPVSLFAEPTPYYFYLNNIDVAQNFSTVGSLLGSAYTAVTVHSPDEFTSAS